MGKESAQGLRGFAVESQAGGHETAQAIKRQIEIIFKSVAAFEKELNRRIPILPAQEKPTQVQQAIPFFGGSHRK